MSDELRSNGSNKGVIRSIMWCMALPLGILSVIALGGVLMKGPSSPDDWQALVVGFGVILAPNTGLWFVIWHLSEESKRPPAPCCPTCGQTLPEWHRLRREGITQ